MTRWSEVPANPANYWHWMHWGPTSVRDTEANTQAVITHELVHAKQIHGWWQDWNALDPATRDPWGSYMAPMNELARLHGPQELEAYATGLDFLPELSRAERARGLQQLFVAFLKTAQYVPPTGVTPETTTAATAPVILAAFTAADAAPGRVRRPALVLADRREPQSRRMAAGPARIAADRERRLRERCQTVVLRLVSQARRADLGSTSRRPRSSSVTPRARPSRRACRSAGRGSAGGAGGRRGSTRRSRSGRPAPARPRSRRGSAARRRTASRRGAAARSRAPRSRSVARLKPVPTLPA